ncbi:putative copper homeostasis (lipo)protein LpqS [Mycolicibacterium arseniciresistens]|uniref:Lipoprotein LpqS n=1 Tax=Mycolicibacterium arseniciresistens TaxID=3062257 RepID=A0ABT8UE29_9MYCO|nr:hypothetical protein [Mycolicibacterium arseniciresistens]MDO3635337.1 hypothetical protein [Mycolicibacterium arseniciresistens]
MRDIDADSHRRGRAVVAALIAFWIVIVGAEWALPGTEPASPHGPHALFASAVGAPASVTVDHPHVSEGGPISPEIAVEAVLPRGTVSLATFGVILVFAMLVMWRRSAPTAVRGPPRCSPQTIFGRRLLEQLCIARR